MKTLKYVLLLALIAFSYSYNQTTPVKSSEKDMKVLTFNIRYGTANDGDNSWQFRKEQLFSLVKEENADIIGLQEALKMQLDEFKTVLPEYAQLGVGREDGVSKGEYSAILYKKDKFKEEKKGHFWFSDTPDVPNSMTWGNKVTRICTWVLLKNLKTGKRFYFYNLHIDHESQPSREKSIEQLLKHTSGNKLPVIITGDFNAGENNKAIKMLLDAGFSDTFRKINPDEKDVATYHAFAGAVRGDKIDFILTTKEFKTLKAEIIRRNKGGKYPSDHFPVSAVVNF